MKPWLRYLALVIGLLAIMVMVVIVTGCESNAGMGAESNPVYAHCINN